MGFSWGIITRETRYHDLGPGLAALEDELDTWAQLCRDGPAVGLYQFVLPIDDQLYWFVSVLDPANCDSFRQLPEDRILKNCAPDDLADGVLIGRMGSWSGLRQEMQSEHLRRGIPEYASPEETDDFFYWGPLLATSTLYYFCDQYTKRPKSWALHPNTAHRVGYDHAYNAELWSHRFTEWRNDRGQPEPVDGTEQDPWLAYLSFTRDWLRTHKLLFGIKDERTCIAPTDEPRRHPVPKLRLNCSGTKALPSGSV